MSRLPRVCFSVFILDKSCFSLALQQYIPVTGWRKKTFPLFLLVLHKNAFKFENNSQESLKVHFIWKWYKIFSNLGFLECFCWGKTLPINSSFFSLISLSIPSVLCNVWIKPWWLEITFFILFLFFSLPQARGFLGDTASTRPPPSWSKRLPKHPKWVVLTAPPLLPPHPKWRQMLARWFVVEQGCPRLWLGRKTILLSTAAQQVRR